jgi:hypothetical protein
VLELASGDGALQAIVGQGSADAAAEYRRSHKAFHKRCLAVLVAACGRARFRRGARRCATPGGNLARRACSTGQGIQASDDTGELPKSRAVRRAATSRGLPQVRRRAAELGRTMSARSLNGLRCEVAGLIAMLIYVNGYAAALTAAWGWWWAVICLAFVAVGRVCQAAAQRTRRTYLDTVAAELGLSDAQLQPMPVTPQEYLAWCEARGLLPYPCGLPGSAT